LYAIKYSSTVYVWTYIHSKMYTVELWNPYPSNKVAETLYQLQLHVHTNIACSA